MGHFKFLLEPSHSTTKSCWIRIIATLMSTLLFLANAQNCQFTMDENSKLDDQSDPWIITTGPISEKLGANETIWDVPTENIASSAASPYPHVTYLTGYRYPSNYVYKTSTSFPEFVMIEHAKEVNRNVTFTCEDGEKLRIHFVFPLIDVNDPPNFVQTPEDELVVDLNKVTPDTIINENSPIIVREIDFTESFMNVSVTSDRSDLLIISPGPTEELGKGVGRLFYIKLKLNLENGKDSISTGRYTLNLFCTDGTYTNSARIIVNIKKILVEA